MKKIYKYSKVDFNIVHLVNKDFPNVDKKVLYDFYITENEKALIYFQIKKTHTFYHKKFLIIPISILLSKNELNKPGKQFYLEKLVIKSFNSLDINDAQNECYPLLNLYKSSLEKRFKINSDNALLSIAYFKKQPLILKEGTYAGSES